MCTRFACTGHTGPGINWSQPPAEAEIRMRHPHYPHRGRTLARIRRVAPLLVDRRLAERGPSYAFQTALATLSLMAIVVVEDVLLHVAIVVAMASTIFIIFVVPDSVAATPRKVIGGHVAGVLAGSIVVAILAIPDIAAVVNSSPHIRHAVGALTLGLSMLLMVATDTEHPPAAGSALGLVLHGWSWPSVGVIIIGAVVLSAIRIALRPRLVNLL